MSQIDITRVTEVHLETIDYLVVESLSQGFRFVDRLVKDYRGDRNCFDKYNEILLVAIANQRAIAIGGLNQDPYSDNSTIGRLRHLIYMSNRVGVDLELEAC